MTQKLAIARSNGSRPSSAGLSTGLSIWRGTITEEYLPQFKPWGKAYKVFTEMADDAVIGAMLESIKTPLLSTPFEVQLGGDGEEDKLAKEFTEENLFNMPDTSWVAHVEEELDFLDYGWAISEKILEKRSDGRIYLFSLIPIGQDTLERWGDSDELGNIKSFIQRDKFGKMREANMDKLLHFTFRAKKRNPEGRSLLRGLYRSWYFKKNLEAIEAIGAERDVGGAPIAELGEGYYSDEDMETLKASLEGLRMDEATYIIAPNGTKISAFGGGNKIYNVREMIRDYQHIIRQRFFADFLSLGSEQVGTQALARELTTFFGLALASVQEKMTDVWNSQLIKPLLALNNFQVENPPVLAWTKPGTRNLQSIAQAFTQLVAQGVLTPDSSVEQLIRQEAGLSPLPPELVTKKDDFIYGKVGTDDPTGTNASKPNQDPNVEEKEFIEGKTGKKHFWSR